MHRRSLRPATASMQGNSLKCSSCNHHRRDLAEPNAFRRSICRELCDPETWLKPINPRKRRRIYALRHLAIDKHIATFGEESVVCWFLCTCPRYRPYGTLTFFKHHGVSGAIVQLPNRAAIGFQLHGLRGEPMIVAEDLRGVRGPDSAPSKIGLDPDLRSKLSMWRRG